MLRVVHPQVSAAYQADSASDLLKRTYHTDGSSRRDGAPGCGVICDMPVPSQLNEQRCGFSAREIRRVSGYTCS